MKKDNHSKQTKPQLQDDGAIAQLTSLSDIPERNLKEDKTAYDIQSSKIFEDVIKLIDEELKNLNHNVDECECCEKLKDFIYKIKEKWGKIER
jgi:uncharacterized FlaG/YvyC family protein